MKRVMALRSNSIANWPLGLFWSEQICLSAGQSKATHLGEHAIWGNTS